MCKSSVLPSPVVHPLSNVVNPFEGILLANKEVKVVIEGDELVPPSSNMSSITILVESTLADSL